MKLHLKVPTGVLTFSEDIDMHRGGYLQYTEMEHWCSKASLDRYNTYFEITKFFLNTRNCNPNRRETAQTVVLTLTVFRTCWIHTQRIRFFDQKRLSLYVLLWYTYE